MAAGVTGLVRLRGSKIEPSPSRDKVALVSEDGELISESKGTGADQWSNFNKFQEALEPGSGPGSLPKTPAVESTGYGDVLVEGCGSFGIPRLQIRRQRDIPEVLLSAYSVESLLGFRLCDARGLPGVGPDALLICLSP